MSAQGNALWNRTQRANEALKGRNRPMLRPFRASEPLESTVHRALPWAGLFNAFGVKTMIAQERNIKKRQRGLIGAPPRLRFGLVVAEKRLSAGAFSRIYTFSQPTGYNQ